MWRRTYCLRQAMTRLAHCRSERLASTQLYGLTASPGRQTQDRFSSSGCVNVEGSVMVIVYWRRVPSPVGVNRSTIVDDGPCGTPLESRYGQSMRLVATTSVAPSQWPLDRPRSVFDNESTFAPGAMLMVRTVSYYSNRNSMVSPLFTNSIG